jgi:hypothetical protein
MKRTIFDVDIDIKSSTDRASYGTRAMIYNGDTQKIQPHPSGVYLGDVPIDPITGLASFDYNYGDDKGFMKVDLLSNTAYDQFTTKAEVIEAVDGVIDWNLFKNRKIVESLPHLAKHFDIVVELEPRNVEDLADILALIRPGKEHLIKPYIKNKESTRRQLYKRPKSGMFFKKSHAISYALMIKSIAYQRYSTGVVF